MNYLEKLTDLVCTEKQINDDLKELRFGTKLITKTGIKRKFIYFENVNGYKFNVNKIYGLDDNGVIKLVNKSQYSIVGNPLEFHHLMGYCKIKNRNSVITESGDFRVLYGYLISSERKTICNLDLTKHLHQQSEEVLKNIFEALIN